MKQKTSLTRIAHCLTLLGLIFFACIISARAQIFPFVDCVERVPGDSTKYVAYFGYNSEEPGNTQLAPNTVVNFFSPTPIADEQIPSVFLPGIHRRVVALTLNISISETWNLASGSATAVFDNNRLCGERDGANSRLITYQGKLNDGAAAANGTYDLQFQLFTGATGTQPRTTPITIEDVSVVGGVFTVQLDLGAATVLPVSGTSVNLKLNPAIVDAENTFLEIGVRPGTSTDAFTKLNPRQPLTAVPLAMRANTATTAFSAVNATNATMRRSDGIRTAES